MKNHRFIQNCFLVIFLTVFSAGLSASETTNGFTVHLIGDSTMADKPLLPANPERGWGQLLPIYFNDNVKVVNYAMNGRSSKSFIDEGRWKKVVAALKPGDYVIIQFGHNDEKDKDPKRYTQAFGSYQTNLLLFIRESREHQATPILATPIARRKFAAAGQLTDTHGDYPKAMREVAQREKVALLDLNTRSMELLAKLGPEPSKRLFDWMAPGEFDRYPKGLSDDTHLNAFGACRICDLATEEMKTAVPALAANLNSGDKSNQGGVEK
jgi:lysophospholipase L1-like esterase